MKLFLAALVAFSFFLVEVPVSADATALFGGPSLGPSELPLLD